MTYHRSNPNGREVKKHLNQFLKLLRAKYPQCGYLWILEFQSRLTAHFHLFLTLSYETNGLHGYLAETWHRIAEPNSDEHLAVHKHPKNFIQWDMGSGAYLCKYLGKLYQKVIPKNFIGVGRFWGSSRNLVPPPYEIPMDDTPDERILIRTLCKHHEKYLRKTKSKRKWHKQARRSFRSHTLPNGANVAWEMIGNRKPPTPINHAVTGGLTDGEDNSTGEIISIDKRQTIL